MSIQPDPSAFRSASAVGREQRTLWLAVIHVAFNDFFERPVGADDPARQAEAREEAERFLFDRSGEWAESREKIAAMAGVNGEAVRMEAWRRLDAATALA